MLANERIFESVTSGKSADWSGFNFDSTMGYVRCMVCDAPLHRGLPDARPGAHDHELADGSFERGECRGCE